MTDIKGKLELSINDNVILSTEDMEQLIGIKFNDKKIYMHLKGLVNMVDNDAKKMLNPSDPTMRLSLLE